MAKVTFDGPNKLIIVNDNITELDVTIDLYSDWKEWAKLEDNLKYLSAFSVIGGQSIGGGKYAGSTFFITNDWKLRPYEGNHTLTINGNIFGEGGSNFIIPVLGNYTVGVQFTNSNLAQGISTSGGNLTAGDVWNYDTRELTSSGTLTTEEHDAIINTNTWSEKILKLVKLIFFTK